MKKITESGAYKELTIEQHHSDCCVAPSVSSTILRECENYSMRHGWLASHLNPDRKFNPAAHFRLGTALHSLAFEGELSPKAFAVSPFDEFRSKESKAWRDKRINEGICILKEKEIPPLQAMMESLLEEPVIAAGLFDERGELETTVIMKDEETGLFVKVRPDVVPTNDIIVDLKSTTDARPRAVRRTIEDYLYYMQLALVDEVLSKVLGQTFKTWALVFVEKTEPYAVHVVELDADFIAWGKVQNRRALRRFADCLSKGPEKENFPKYEFGVSIVRPSPWMVERLTKEQESNLLPKFIEAGYMGG